MARGWVGDGLSSKNLKAKLIGGIISRVSLSKLA